MALTDPVFVDADPAAILSEVLSDLQTLTGHAIEPAQPEYAIASAIAYHKSLTMNRINAAGKAMLVDFSTGSVLDYLAAAFNITRLPAEGAVCTLVFTLVSGHLPVTIPLGTRVASTDGTKVFTTNDDITAGTGVNTVSVTATCTTAGTTGNGYAIGTVSVLMDPYPYISAVANTDITAGGSNAETDDELRARMKLATSMFSVAGSRNAYIYWAKTASSLISDIKVLTYEDDNDIAPGEVDIYALLEGGELPTEAVNNRIAETLSSETVRPLTDTVVVKTAIAQNYTLEVAVTKTAEADGPTLTDSIRTILTDYTTERKQKLGQDIVATYVEAISRIDGVYDVTATITPDTGTLTGRNLVVSDSEVAVCTDIVISL